MPYTEKEIELMRPLLQGIAEVLVNSVKDELNVQVQCENLIKVLATAQHDIATCVMSKVVEVNIDARYHMSHIHKCSLTTQVHLYDLHFTDNGAQGLADVFQTLLDGTSLTQVH